MPAPFVVAKGQDQIEAIRSPAHRSPLHELLSAPESAVFRAMSPRGEGVVTIGYTLREPTRFAAGNGVSRSFRGYFSSPAREGILDIDTRTLTPRRHVVHDIVETLDEYVEVAPGRFAPLAIRIRGPAHCDWRFRVIDGLWMLGELRLPDGSPMTQGTVSSIIINGRPIE